LDLVVRARTDADGAIPQNHLGERIRVRYNEPQMRLVSSPRREMILALIACGSWCVYGCTEGNIGDAADLLDNDPPPADAGPDAQGPDAELGDDEVDAGDAPCTAGDRQVVDANGICFFAFEGPETWQNARQRCIDAGGDLARIDSAAENDTVFVLANTPAITGQPDWWLGGNDLVTENRFVWLDDNVEIVAPLFEIWRDGEPNDGGTNGEDCMILEADNANREWDDRECEGDVFPYICERTP
jgi:hypothetical protein